MKRTGELAFVLAVLLLAGGARADYDRAIAAFKSGHYTESASLFQALLDGSPTWDAGYYMLGRSQAALGQSSEAEKNYLRAIELAGDTFEYHASLAKLQFDRKQYGKVIGTLNNGEKLASDGKSKFIVYSLRGYSRAILAKWADAIGDLEKARGIQSDPGLVMQLGKGYFALGHNDKAVPLFREAVRQGASDKEARRLLGESLLNLGAETSVDASKRQFFSEALANAEALFRLEPGSADASYLLGRAALGAGEFDRAVTTLKGVTQKQPDNCNAQTNLGKAFLAKKDWANALAALEAATQCAPRLGVAWESKGLALQMLRRYEDALAAYGEAKRIKPGRSLDSAIASCQKSLEIAQFNKQVDSIEAQQRVEEEESRREFEEQQRRAAEWQKRQKGG